MADSNDLPEQVKETTIGILEIRGHQTLCNVIILTANYGIVAPTCLQLTKNNELDKSVPQRVVIADKGVDYIGIYDITLLIVHPAFDSNTAANNLAIVKFDKADKLDDFQLTIADNQDSWTRIYYYHQSYNSKNDIKFNDPRIVDSSVKDNPECSQLSQLYDQNKDAFICSLETIPWYGNLNCSSPYGAAFAGYSNKAKVAALYSHSVLTQSDTKCGKGSVVYSYYTVLAKYVNWISSNTNWKFSPGSDKANTNKLDFRMESDNTFKLPEGAAMNAGYKYLKWGDSGNGKGSSAAPSSSSIPDDSNTTPVASTHVSNTNNNVNPTGIKTVTTTTTSVSISTTTLISYVTINVDGSTKTSSGDGDGNGVPVLGTNDVVEGANPSRSGLSSGAIVGMVVGIIAIVALVCVGYFFYKRRSTTEDAEKVEKTTSSRISSMRTRLFGNKMSVEEDELPSPTRYYHHASIRSGLMKSPV